MYIWGFTKKPVLSITSSGEIGIWKHDIEVSKMQGRARGRKGERKTYHINPYHHITMEFGVYLLNVAKKTTRARARKGRSARGPILPKSNRNFRQPPYTYILYKYIHIYNIYIYTHVLLDIYIHTLQKKSPQKIHLNFLCWISVNGPSHQPHQSSHIAKGRSRQDEDLGVAWELDVMASNFDMSQEVEDSGPRFSAVVLMRVVGVEKWQVGLWGQL